MKVWAIAVQKKLRNSWIIGFLEMIELGVIVIGWVCVEDLSRDSHFDNPCNLAHLQLQYFFEVLGLGLGWAGWMNRSVVTRFCESCELLVSVGWGVMVENRLWKVVCVIDNLYKFAGCAPNQVELQLCGELSLELYKHPLSHRWAFENTLHVH